MVGSPSPFCNDSSNSPTLGCSVSSLHILYIVCKLFAKGRLACNFWETVGKKLCFFTVYFDRELMKGNDSVSWDYCGCKCSKCVSYVFICISLCFIIQFMFISSEIFWVRLGRIQFYCSACGKISCSVLFFCWKGFMLLCPFHFLQQSIHAAVPQTKLLHFPPTSPHGIICAFVLNSLFFAERRSHNIPEARSFMKIVSRTPIHLLA